MHASSAPMPHWSRSWSSPFRFRQPRLAAIQALRQARPNSRRGQTDDSPKQAMGLIRLLTQSTENAFAAPGGYTFVTRGLIDRVADESELAGILAHEIAHVVQRHHLQAMRKTARAGFDPYGLVAVLQQLRTATPDNPVFTLSLSTHPAPQAQLDQVELAMGRRLDAFTGKTAVPVQQRIDMLAQAEQRRAAATAAAAAAIARPAASPAAPAKGTARPTAKPAARASGTTKKP